MKDRLVEQAVSCQGSEEEEGGRPDDADGTQQHAASKKWRLQVAEEVDAKKSCWVRLVISLAPWEKSRGREISKK